MAASLGATSLGEVHHERLDELLHDLANVCPASEDCQRPSLGIPVLDALVEVFMLKTMGPVPHHQDQDHDIPPGSLQAEEREQLLPEDEEMLFTDEFGDAALDEQIAQHNLFFDSAYRTKRPIPTVEISSNLSGAGKSQLLYYMTALAVLPRQYGNILIGGQDSAVVFIDADDRFDVHRLRVVARGIVQQAHDSIVSEKTEGRGVSDDDFEDLLSSALKHVHIFRPQSSSALLATLATLDAYLYAISRHYSASCPLQMIAIDSATAFLWQDKLRDSFARTEDLGRSREENDELRELKQSFHFVDLYTEIVKELKRLQARFGCTVVYTTTVSAFRPNKANGGNGPLRPYDQSPSRTPALPPALPAPWGEFPLLRLVVQRDATRSFPPSMSAHDARKDAPMRQNAVRQGKFSAYVNAWRQEEWPRRVVEGLRAYDDGSFPFYVRGHGIHVPLPGA
ncbi:hypothetical protein N7520_004074 [Penicillium odoratum]|uniref:uncharacterized protein n=1 Tax=Penicillium odoratum TaxID=1167516 RepID=UPI0025481661|nr:uncharacterized protein N7520_004074 [Penicillium odoratum]KAJ5769515.1 hypothetical protein N7520_004074 [Penicillium odoratum]